jgi:hypothetical protein
MELQAQLYVRRGRGDGFGGLSRTRRNCIRKIGARVKLTALELQSGPDFDRPIARETLESMVSDDDFALLALRGWRPMRCRATGFARGAGLVKACQRTAFVGVFGSDAVFTRSFREVSGFRELPAELDQVASENLQFVLELAKWKADALGPEATSVWLNSLPESMRENTAICLILADCCSALKKWSDLESLVATSGVNSSALRFALLSRAQAEQGDLRKSERMRGNWRWQRLKGVLSNWRPFSQWRGPTSTTCVRFSG